MAETGGENLGKVFVDLDANLSPLKAAFALGLGLIANWAVDAAAEMDTAMRNVWTIAGDTTEAGLNRYRDQIVAMSRELPQTQKQLAEGLYQVLSAGINTADSMYVLGVAAKAASAGLTDSFTTVDALTTVLSSYRMEASEAGKVADIMFKAVERGKMTFEQMSSALGDVVPTAALAGVSFEEVAAAMATITRGGISANESATALNRLMMSIVKPTDDAKTAAAEAGVDLSLAHLQAVGLSGILAELMSASGGALDKLAEFIPEIRSLKGALTAGVGGGADMAADLLIMENSLGATEAAFAKQKDSLENNLKLMKNSINEFAIAIGEALSPVVKEVADFVSKLAQGFASLPADTQKVVTAIAILAAAFGPLKAAISGLIGIMTGPAGWIIAIGVVVAAIVTLISKNKEWEEAALKAGDENKRIIDGLMEAGQKAGEQAKSLEGLIANYEDLSKNMTGTAGEQERLNSLIKEIGKIAPGVVESWDSMGNAIKINIGMAKEQLKSIYQTQLSYYNAAFSAANAQVASMKAAHERALKELEAKQKAFEKVQLRYNLDVVIDADQANWNKRAGAIYKSEVKPLLTKEVSKLTDAEIKALMEYLAGGAGQMATDIGKVFNGLKAQSADFAGSVTADAVAVMFQKIAEGGKEGAKLLGEITDLSQSVAAFYELQMEADSARIKIEGLTAALKEIPAVSGSGSSAPATGTGAKALSVMAPVLPPSVGLVTPEVPTQDGLMRQLGIYKDEVLLVLREIRNAVLGAELGDGYVRAGIEQTFHINSVNIYAANNETFSDIMRDLSRQVRLSASGVGG